MNFTHRILGPEHSSQLITQFLAKVLDHNICGRWVRIFDFLWPPQMSSATNFLSSWRYTVSCGTCTETLENRMGVESHEPLKTARHANLCCCKLLHTYNHDGKLRIPGYNVKATYCWAHSSFAQTGCTREVRKLPACTIHTVRPSDPQHLSETSY